MNAQKQKSVPRRANLSGHSSTFQVGLRHASIFCEQAVVTSHVIHNVYILLVSDIGDSQDITHVSAIPCAGTRQLFDARIQPEYMAYAVANPWKHTYVKNKSEKKHFITFNSEYGLLLRHIATQQETFYYGKIIGKISF